MSKKHKQQPPKRKPSALVKPQFIADVAEVTGTGVKLSSIIDFDEIDPVYHPTKISEDVYAG